MNDGLLTWVAAFLPQCCLRLARSVMFCAPLYFLRCTMSSRRSLPWLLSCMLSFSVVLLCAFHMRCFCYHKPSWLWFACLTFDIRNVGPVLSNALCWTHTCHRPAVLRSQSLHTPRTCTWIFLIEALALNSQHCSSAWNSTRNRTSKQSHLSWILGSMLCWPGFHHDLRCASDSVVVYSRVGFLQRLI